MGRHARDQPAQAARPGSHREPPAQRPPSSPVPGAPRAWLVRAAVLVAAAVIAGGVGWSVGAVTAGGGPEATALGAVTPMTTGGPTPTPSGVSRSSAMPGRTATHTAAGDPPGSSEPIRAGPMDDGTAAVDEPTDAWAGESPHPPGIPGRPAVSIPGTSASWQTVLAALDAHRSAAFASGDDALLERVYAPGSAPLARDAAVLERLAGAGQHAVGLRLTVDEVAVVTAAVDAVTLRVVDQMPAYRIVDGLDRHVATVPGRGAAAWLLTLTPGPDGWLISAVLRA